MNESSREFLYSLAARFRRAIERSDPSTSPLVTLREFPRGACVDASLLLAKYLQVCNCGSSVLVFGERDGERHAWLRLEELIVDITADQFDDQEADVIVAAESPWHSSFDGKAHNLADFCLYAPDSVFELTKAYRAITRHLH